MIGVVFAYKAVAGRNVLWVDIAACGLCIALAQGACQDNCVNLG